MHRDFFPSTFICFSTSSQKKVRFITSSISMACFFTFNETFQLISFCFSTQLYLYKQNVNISFKDILLVLLVLTKCVFCNFFTSLHYFLSSLHFFNLREVRFWPTGKEKIMACKTSNSTTRVHEQGLGIYTQRR